MLNCSDELLENLRDFFLRRGGATGPLEVMESVVFECANLVLAITSGSCNIIAPSAVAVDCAVGTAVAVKTGMVCLAAPDATTDVGAMDMAMTDVVLGGGV